MAGKTMGELLAELQPSTFTAEDYEREQAALLAACSRKYGLHTIEEIDAAMRVHAIPHEEEDLVDRWIELMALKRYVLAGQGARNT